MSEAWIDFNGTNSVDMYLKIQNDISFSSPGADIEFIEVVGRDGDLAIDYNRLKSIDMSFPVTLDLRDGYNVNQVATKISEWLKKETGYFPLRFSGEEDYYYMAICYEQFDIRETLRQFGKTVITFKVQPYKYRMNNETIVLSSGQTLVNPEKRVSKPLMKIKGTGDISIQNNGIDWLILRSVEGEITVDSNLMSAYKNDRPAYDKMVGILNPMFPVLAPGENTITWTGTVTELTIEPKWEAII